MIACRLDALKWETHRPAKAAVLGQIADIYFAAVIGGNRVRWFAVTHDGLIAYCPMRRRVISAALVLWFGGSIANAADQYGEWSLETLNSAAPVLFNRDMRPGEDKILVAELGFTCDRRYKAGQIGAVLIPFEGTYANQQHDVIVLVKKALYTITPSDLSQKWQNGFKYIFLNDQDLMDKLVAYLKINEANGTESAHFLFAGDFNGRPDSLNHVDITLSGFSNGFAALNTACNGQ